MHTLFLSRLMAGMTSLRTICYSLMAICLISAGASTVALAETSFPTKPIKIIVGFAPGGGSDFIARIVAQKLSQKLGQTVFVENRPGAGGNLGAEIAMKSAGDGYTLFLAATSYTVNANLYKLPFDPVHDITPIARLASGPFIIATNPELPVKNLKELVELAKKDPGKLSYASAGNGSITHIATEYFLTTAGIDVLHVPYKGTSPALTDTISGQVQFIFGTVASTMPHVQSGKLKPLAVTTAKRLAALPEVPTVMESGYPNFEVPNPFNRIPGFFIRNHTFVPGFPVMAWPMLEWTLDNRYAHLHHQTQLAEHSFVVYTMPESRITPALESLEKQWPGVRAFSLPSVGEAGGSPHIELGVKGEPEAAALALAFLRSEAVRLGARFDPPVAHP